MQRIPEMTVVPAHDERDYAQLARLPDVITNDGASREPARRQASLTTARRRS